MARRLGFDDLRVNRPLPWPVFDGDGNLLLSKGALITSEAQLLGLVASGLYRATGNNEAELEEQQRWTRVAPTPFEQLAAIVLQLGRLLEGARARPRDVADRLERLVSAVMSCCVADEDAALGFVHLFHDAPYAHYHPVKIALLALLVARALAQEATRPRALVGASLTCNVSMLDIHSQLQAQVAPISPGQWARVEAHPEQSAALLKALGIVDPEWLKTVRHHHERCDGSGYPEGLAGDAIPLPARILAACDRYAASIAARRYRDSLSPIQALQAAYTEQQAGQGGYDERVVGTLIRQLGVYPPGSTVKLANGEGAVVIRRNREQSTEPLVAAVESAEGRAYAIALRRDTRTPRFRVVRSAPLARPLRLSPGYLWGYRETPAGSG